MGRQRLERAAAATGKRVGLDAGVGDGVAKFRTRLEVDGVQLLFDLDWADRRREIIWE